METDPITTTTNTVDALALGRKNTKKIALLLTFVFLCMIVSVFISGINNNFPSAISSILMILAFSKMAEYNPTESGYELYHKYYWVSYIAAGIMFVFAFKNFIRSYILFDDMFGQALMWIAFGVYFVFFKPSECKIGYKALKFMGYILLGLSVNASYMCSIDRVTDSIICVVMYLIGAALLYLANKSHLQLLFKDTN